ncbi:F-box/kelch-repeat protein SKIP25-like [Rhododendron vialii]|uniref:F-box/kelch-repeat protein SKIP25-like n=1 Tax=Rhododendron vialii TaxID=182163 RepID=UPI0026600F33|nr:F-box/kelch-repeat protein SKIP25-like [Rhododendron vialii]
MEEMAQAPIPSTAITVSSTPTTKRHKTTDRCEPDHQPLLPGLPDHIAQLILSLVHRPATLYSVCRSWRRLLYSPSFLPFLSLYALVLPDQSQSHRPLEIYTLDPVSSSDNWQALPPPPHPPLRPVLRHPSFLSRNLPIQSVSVSGNLVLLAATADNLVPALPRPLVFDPVSRSWGFGPPIDTPRRWCAAGTSRSTVFVASGIGSHYAPDVARSVEKWDLGSNNSVRHRSNGRNWKWEKLEPMRDAKFSREAIDAVGWRGKLCMVNVKGGSAKQGVIYDVAADDWSEMPDGMISGWRGPAAAMDEETLYAVDETKGVLRKYDAGADGWEEILAEERLVGAEQMAAGGGRVCVVESGGGIVVVDVVASPARVCGVLDVPVGFQAVAVHVLPRMSRPD